MQQLIRQLRLHPHDRMLVVRTCYPACSRRRSCDVASSLGVAIAASVRCRLLQCWFRGRSVSQNAVMALIRALRAVCGWWLCSRPPRILLAVLAGLVALLVFSGYCFWRRVQNRACMDRTSCVGSSCGVNSKNVCSKAIFELVSIVCVWFLCVHTTWLCFRDGHAVD